MNFLTTKTHIFYNNFFNNEKGRPVGPTIDPVKRPAVPKPIYFTLDGV